MAFEPSAFLALPEASYFSFPLHKSPPFLAPPAPGTASFAPPFEIPDHIYQAVLDPKVPITIAVTYTITAKLLNAYNRSTGKKPWAISKTRAFKWFVIFHNVLLAVYSAWTFVGMFGALRRSMVSPLGPDGLAGFVDSVCRINGPAGLGNAVFYNEATDSWQSYNADVALTANGAPSPLDAGRLWNEGLAFYGWIFYLSKFYEVIDTLIILAKGKFGSTLQTYHHAGAMMCMWAGMRYMSAPIWMFAFVNSGIHALMYTYYTITAFNVRVPTFIKRSLTTMQITQFLVGGSYATLHSFVNYYVPVIGGAAQAAPATSSAAVNGSAAAIINDKTGTASARVEMPCVNTAGATFAVWLNVLYLAPLTYLFMAFFVESYLRRSNAEKKAGKQTVDRRMSNTAVLAEKAGWDAAKSVEREVYGQGNEEAVIDETPARKGKTSGRALRSCQ
ncbi:GNS1/SUR4 family-domain-containing protein [Cercophora scortea]|uniref:Elongation of fatty acids protein n=1 Tax=Cercophora scortea TaxID=314031 RepID=A0AAE0IYC7_9PEZI|nr:GNS1/SUR4 family-domain-containing protein [Cercophora scortea]